MTPPILPKTTQSMPKITVYGPEDCPNCEKATSLFDRRGIPYRKVIISPGDDGHTYVTKTLGYQAAPVITVETEEPDHLMHWGGHRMDLLMALVKLCATVPVAA